MNRVKEIRKYKDMRSRKEITYKEFQEHEKRIMDYDDGRSVLRRVLGFSFPEIISIVEAIIEFLVEEKKSGRLTTETMMAAATGDDKKYSPDDAFRRNNESMRAKRKFLTSIYVSSLFLSLSMLVNGFLSDVNSSKKALYCIIIFVIFSSTLVQSYKKHPLMVILTSSLMSAYFWYALGAFFLHPLMGWLLAIFALFGTIKIGFRGYKFAESR